MAIPILRASSSRTPQSVPNLAFDSSSSTTSRHKRLISCVLSDSEVKPVRQELCFTVGTHLIPYPKKVDRGGRWSFWNVDPSLFPKELLVNASINFGDDETLVKKAHADTSSKGSATVIVAMLERTGTLKIANVGDCSLRVIRRGQIVFTTSSQEHYFDCPFQLSSEVVTEIYLDAMVCSVNLMEGDTVVMGSDGLFDNAFDQEIVITVSQHNDVTEDAKALAVLANAHSIDLRFALHTLWRRGAGCPLWHPWMVDNYEIGGSTQVYEGLTFVTVKAAGHQVPRDPPLSAPEMVSHFLNGTALPGPRFSS